MKPEPITPGMLVIRSSAPIKPAVLSRTDGRTAGLRRAGRGLHTETGPGVYEAAILFTEGITAADRALLFKQSAKEIGHRFRHHAQLHGPSGTRNIPVAAGTCTRVCGTRNRTCSMTRKPVSHVEAVRELSRRASSHCSKTSRPCSRRPSTATSAWSMACGRRSSARGRWTIAPRHCA